MPKATIEVEIPDGYEFVRFGRVHYDDYFLATGDDGNVSYWCSNFESAGHFVILRKVAVTELAVRFKPGWVAMDRNGSWCWYPHKPNLSEVMWDSDEKYSEWLDEFIQMPAVTDWKQSLMRVG